MWRILADFVADFVAGSTKPLDNQGVLSANARCGRDSNRIFISHIIILTKYQNISDLLDKSDLSVRRIAAITGHSANTVLKIKQLKEI